MRKIMAVIFAALIAFSALGMLTGCSNKETREKDTLIIYAAKDYFAASTKENNKEIKGTIEKFEEYYREKTNRPKFKVKYETYSDEATILKNVRKNNADYDLIIASNHLLFNMDDSLTIQPFDTNKIQNYSNISPFIRNKHSNLHSNSDGKTNSIGYTWGTVGILYDSKYASAVNEGWGTAWNDTYKKSFYMNDMPRDMYAIASIYANKDALKKESATGNTATYLETLTSTINNTSSENVEKVKKALKSLEINAKDSSARQLMAKGKKNFSISCSGDAIWAINEAKKVNISLNYTVPTEGGVFWYDGFALSNYAKNTNAAHEFVNFMLDPQIAIENMEYTGHTSSVATMEIYNWIGKKAGEQNAKTESVNLKYFFSNLGDAFDLTNVKITQSLYPSKTVVDRCAEQKGYSYTNQGEQNLIFQTWSNAKVDVLTIVLIIALCVVGVALITVVSVVLYKKYGNKKTVVIDSKKGYRKNGNNE